MRAIYFETYDEIDRLLKRDVDSDAQAYEQVVAEIVSMVRKQGDIALRAYSARFDGYDSDDFLVAPIEIEAAVKRTDPAFMKVLQNAAENIKEYHQKQKQEDYQLERDNGVILGRRVIPLERVGIYIPGGTASYPSSVLMNVIPAKIAGVDEIVLITPPNEHGKIADEILAAAYVTKVDKIYKLGGAHGVAALAYGTQTIPSVDKIVGPGNIYVATAKKQVFGQVDIDMIAGPSEILVIADDTANPNYVAIDLLSQAEHDPLSACALVTTSPTMAREVSDILEKLVPTLNRESIIKSSIESFGLIIIADNLEQCAQISNHIAPEHLEICTADPFEMLPLIRNAGSVFLGNYTPEAVGDYIAGPNHTLPTNGTAKFSSGLSVEDFVKKSSYIYYTKEALKEDGNSVEMFANREGLDAHARSVTLRLEDFNNE